MKYPNLLFILLLAAALPAQEPVPNPSEKGAAPLNPQSVIRPETSGQSTRAVIVGISDYQSPHIPDLRFAHRDAEAFAEWLRSPAGGNVPADNVQIFTDKKATNAAVITALDALLDVCQPGDQVVFYFSGHGDVETKTRSNPGFLLTHDTPPNVYMAGAINLRDLLDIVGTLSDKQVKVILITDACHAGKLAGSNAGGTHATAYSLQQQFANEVKIMSCQPNEFSLEGEEWGGGRGVFSYHLIDALTGLADKNEDDMVNLLEAGRYLEETVPAATAPHPQMPVTSGNRLTTLARVDAASLAALKQSKTGSTTLLSSTGSKGLEDEVLARADSLTRARYHAFKMALDGNKLLENNDSCADAHFRYLIGQEVLSPLYGLMRRNFAVALLDEVQQSLNAILEADPTEVNTWKFKPDKYTLYPAYLDRAMELVGQRHFLHKTLMAKKLFFEAYLANFYAVGFNTKLASDSLKKDIQRKLHRAMGYDSTAAYLYYLMGNTFQSSFRIDSLDHYYRQANSLSPGWMLPATELAFIYINHYPNHRKAREILESAVANHPRSYVGLEMLAWVYQRFNLMDSIESVCARMRAIQPAAPNDLATLGYSHLFITRNYPKAELYFKKALEVDSSVAWHVKYGLAELHFLSRNPAQGQKWLQAVPAELRRFFDPTELILHRYYIRSGRYREADSVLMVLRSAGITHPGDLAINNTFLGEVNYYRGRLDSAKILLHYALQLDTTPNEAHPLAYALLGAVAARENHPNEAEYYFQKAFSYYPDLFNGYGGGDFKNNGLCLYGDFLLAQGRLTEAEAVYREVIGRDPGHYMPYYGMARLLAAQKQTDGVLDYLEMALDRWYPIPGPILEEPLFKKLRKTKRFKALMARHFPKEE